MSTVCLFQVGDYSISLKAPEKNKHFRVVVDAGMFCIGPQTFDSLDDLVQHYKKHPIFRHGTDKLFLVKAFIQPEISEEEDDLEEVKIAWPNHTK